MIRARSPLHSGRNRSSDNASLRSPTRTPVSRLVTLFAIDHPSCGVAAVKPGRITFGFTAATQPWSMARDQLLTRRLVGEHKLALSKTTGCGLWSGDRAQIEGPAADTQRTHLEQKPTTELAILRCFPTTSGLWHPSMASQLTGLLGQLNPAVLVRFNQACAGAIVPLRGRTGQAAKPHWLTSLSINPQRCRRRTPPARRSTRF